MTWHAILALKTTQYILLYWKKENEKMEKLSISFTLGKASKPNQVNLKYNNREFIAKNVNFDKII